MNTIIAPVVCLPDLLSCQRTKHWALATAVLSSDYTSTYTRAPTCQSIHVLCGNCERIRRRYNIIVLVTIPIYKIINKSTIVVGTVCTLFTLVYDSYILNINNINRSTRGSYNNVLNFLNLSLLNYRRLFLLTKFLLKSTLGDIDCPKILSSLMRFRINCLNTKNNKPFHPISYNKNCILNAPANI